MELSTTKKNEAKKQGVTVQELIFADLTSIGYSEVDAYTIAYPEDAALSSQMQQVNRRKIATKVRFTELCEQRKIFNANILKFSNDAKDIELIDSELTAKEILKIAKQMPEGSKERGEMFMKYADLTRKNDAATDEATEQFNFYFPIKCNQCPLFDAYKSYLKQNKKKELRPVEIEAVIRNAAPIMEKARKKAGV